jgi:predicted NAD/FAD-dependent oxidoreductase
MSSLLLKIETRVETRNILRDANISTVQRQGLAVRKRDGIWVDSKAFPGAHDARAALAAPLHNTLYFAGEATDSHHSTVHGALASGRRAAIELLRARQRWFAW